MRGLKLLMLLGCGAALLSGASGGVYGQTPAPAGTPPAPSPTFSLNLQDSPVRAALKQLFEAAHVQYSIDNRVGGFETLHITDQPFEEALKIVLRSSSIPLAFTRENGVYFIKPRVIPSISIDRVPAPEAEQVAKSSRSIDVLTLNHADPCDLAALLGIKIVPTSTRMAGSRGTTTGTPPVGVGAVANPNGASSGALGFDTGTLISSDAGNDIVRIGN